MFWPIFWIAQNKRQTKFFKTKVDCIHLFFSNHNFSKTSKKNVSNVFCLIHFISDQSHVNLFSSRPQPKKKRKSRTAFTNNQIFELEKRFIYQKYLSPADRDEIAASLGLSNAQVRKRIPKISYSSFDNIRAWWLWNQRACWMIYLLTVCFFYFVQVITWFQNRRAKLKRDMEELKKDVESAKVLSAHKTFLENVNDLGILKKKAMHESTALMMQPGSPEWNSTVTACSKQPL